MPQDRRAEPPNSARRDVLGRVIEGIAYKKVVDAQDQTGFGALS